MIKNLSFGVLVGVLLTAPLIGLIYVAHQLAGLPFIPFDLFNWLVRVLPGDLITFGIDTMIDTMLFLGLNVADTAKTAERTMAVLQFLAVGVAISAIFFVVLGWGRRQADRLAGLVAGALFGLPMIGISLAISQSTVTPLVSIIFLLIVFFGWGLLLALSYQRLSTEAEAAASPGEARTAQAINRRQFLVRLGTSSAVITVIGAGVGAVLAQQEERRLAAQLATSEAHDVEETTKSSFPNANDPVVPVPGTRPEYTPVKDHYKVFLQTEPTVINGADYVLPITGLVANPLMLTLDDIRSNYEARDQYVTLSCISGRIGTSLISTTQWTGVSMQAILADASVQENGRYLHITSGDGFYETVDLDLIAADERIMLCYAWDGNTLPVDHGFPLRIWLPDRYGMKQPKWITGMEVSADYTPGYWVERNWDEVAQVKTTSVIDTVAVDHIIEMGDERRVPIGGIAFSGARGISQVEVRVDGGEWQPAELRSPLSETTWVIWRYEWPFTAGEHQFEVRCAEGDGTPQIEEAHKNRPSGATGIHSVEATL
ncbi:MAG: molybdopterin-dependent oxidoreductase [Anaerolineaceae bacterium]|nr:molybdopterin-dependent oxidoreductase [Anaerolineaceae bacterium]